MIEPQETDELPLPPKRFAWGKALSIGLIVLGLGTLIVYVNTRSSAAEELADLLAELDRTEPGWRWEQIQAARALIADEQNGALQVIAFRKTLPQNWYKDVEALQALELHDPRVYLNDEQWAALTALLQKHPAAVAEARKLAGYSTGRFPIKYKRDYFSVLLPDSQECRNASMFLSYDLLDRLERGDTAGAVVNVRAMLGAARAHGDEPFPICQFIRMAVRQEALRGIERVLSRAELDAATLARLQAEFQAEVDTPLPEIMAKGERAALHEFFQALRDGDPDANRAVRYFVESESEDHSLWSRGQYWFIGDGAPRDNAAALRYLTRFLDATRLPVEQQEEAFKALNAEKDQLPLLARTVLDGHTSGRIHVGYRANLAHLRPGVAAIAAERYRLQYGKWPAKLEDLVPDFLAAVPLDPFDGAPLRYRIVEHGAVIYSIGPDGKDDAGRLQRRYVVSPADTGDYGFELWNLDQRQARTER